MKKISYVGTIIGLLAMGLAWYWFGWQLVVVLMLAIWGNNVERLKDKQ